VTDILLNKNYYLTLYLYNNIYSMKQLTDLQIEIQKLWADKTLSFGCIIRNIHDYYIILDNRNFASSDWTTFWTKELHVDVNRDIRLDENLWRPLDFSRLQYLHLSKPEDKKNFHWFWKILNHFKKNLELYNQDTLSRDAETNILVRDFLLTL
jgi:hypothetical protein